jgi:FixJ family two-component response regulator
MPGFGCADAGFERAGTAGLVAEGHRVPIIFITAFSDENARAQALKAGALCYLVKPFEEADLLNSINLALQR